MPDIFGDVTKLANQHLDAATAEAWLRLVRPAAALVEATPDDDAVARLGGQPRLPAGTPWPRWDAITPLSYVGELDLAALAAAGYDPGVPLPSDGRLAFFVLDDSDGQGFADGSDLDSYRVLHLPDGGTTTPPPVGAHTYAEQTLSARQVVTAPDAFDRALPAALGIDADADYRAWLDHPVRAPEFFDAFEASRGTLPRHQVGGWASAVQGPVEVEAAHAEARRRSLSNESSGSSDLRTGEVADMTDRWVLLFQVDSYDSVMWGDVGTLYWLARAEDLSRGDLSNIRFVMQCC
ncbi:YwqG family protein [Promicromonospora iranensis]|uniref:YwqG family protein n=1 Tax=Promicromonospora iranensis TaxID=1105144 RepID=UPI0023A96A07|nr:YwqG family protein [Promicromonospora iranensis]